MPGPTMACAAVDTRPTILTTFALLALSSAPAFAAAPATLIKGVTLHSVVPEEPPLPNAEVLIRGDRVQCIGVSDPRPAAAGDPRTRKSCAPTAAGATVHDFAGKGVVIPGLIESLSRMGLVEIDLEDNTHDGVARRASNLAHVRAIDGVVTLSRAVEAARKGGVTVSLARPVGNATVVGQSVAFRTGGQLVGEAAVRDGVAMHLTLGDEAKNGEPVVGARSGQFAVLRELLGNAQRINSQDPKKKLSPAEAESLQKLRDDPALLALATHLKSGRPVVAHVQRADDIAALLRVQRDFGLRLVVAGGAEAHVVAADLAAAKVPVILAPVRARPYDPANRRARDDAAALLAKAGVKLAIATGDTHNARNLRWDAGFAVANGLDWTAALAAVTRHVAEILELGQGPRAAVGTVTEGGPADLVVFDGDPLGMAARVRLVVCGGQVEVDPRQR
ncbi:MAG: hypothetical protein FJ100_20665 [Deltaproteobacteria bacterium]|nr:hypothetical protein [Deltaproteobacteria bacterium]